MQPTSAPTPPTSTALGDAGATGGSFRALKHRAVDVRFALTPPVPKPGVLRRCCVDNLLLLVSVPCYGCGQLWRLVRDIPCIHSEGLEIQSKIEADYSPGRSPIAIPAALSGRITACRSSLTVSSRLSASLVKPFSLS